MPLWSWIWRGWIWRWAACSWTLGLDLEGLDLEGLDLEVLDLEVLDLEVGSLQLDTGAGFGGIGFGGVGFGVGSLQLDIGAGFGGPGFGGPGFGGGLEVLGLEMGSLQLDIGNSWRCWIWSVTSVWSLPHTPLPCQTTAFTCVFRCFPCDPSCGSASWATPEFTQRSVAPMVKMTRSKTFQAYLPSCHRTYSCIHCRAHLANHDELISKAGIPVLQRGQPVSLLFSHSQAQLDVGDQPADSGSDTELLQKG
ncbi:yippee like 2 [Pitangus sulphuratus]|nr:yippee like 2 [Pitangus sulphuratus]